MAAPARTTAPLRGGSAGDSQAHSASALVSGFQPKARLSGTPLRCLLFLIVVFGGIQLYSQQSDLTLDIPRILESVKGALLAQVSRAGFEPATKGLKGPCSA